MPDAAANRRGIAAMTAAMACFCINDTFVKLAAASLPTSQILAVRGVFAIAFFLAVAAAMGALAGLRHARAPLVLLRAGVEATVAVTFITALGVMPIADITAILLASPLIITALSVPLFGETVGWRRWAAVVAGFAGMLLVVKPGGADFTVHTLLAVTSAVLVAVRDLMTRRIDPAVPSHAITLATTLAVTALGVLLLGAETATGAGWRPVSGAALGFLAAAAAFVIVGNYFIIVAFRGVEMSVVSPFRYTIIMWAIAMGMLVFGERPDGLALAGIGLVVAAGLYTLHRERVRAAQAVAK